MDFENLLQRYRESSSTSSSDMVGMSNEPSSSGTTTDIPRKITTDMILDRLRKPSDLPNTVPATSPDGGLQDLDIEKFLSDTGGRVPSSTHGQAQPLPTESLGPYPTGGSAAPSLSLADILGAGAVEFPVPPVRHPVVHPQSDPIVMPPPSQDLFTALTRIEALSDAVAESVSEAASTPHPPSSSPEEVLSKDLQNAEAIEELKARIRDEVTQKYLSRAEIDEKVIHCVEICDEMRETVRDLKKRFFEIELHFRFLRQIMAVDDSEIEMYVRDLQAAVPPSEPLRVFPVSVPVVASTPPAADDASPDPVDEGSTDASGPVPPPAPTPVEAEETTTSFLRPLVVQPSPRSAIPVLKSSPTAPTPQASSTAAADEPSDPTEKRPAAVRPRPLLPAPPSKNPMSRFQKMGYSSTYANVFPVL